MCTYTRRERECVSLTLSLRITLTVAKFFFFCVCDFEHFNGRRLKSIDVTHMIRDKLNLIIVPNHRNVILYISLPFPAL